MRIDAVTANNRRRAIMISTERGNLAMPYSRLDPTPTRTDPVREVYVDPELGREAFTYLLASGAEGSVHVDAVLEYNEDPTHMRELLVYRLTLEARKCLEFSPLSNREIMRRLGTSPAQFYRLLDTTNTRKSLDGLVRLLAALDCELDFTLSSRHRES